MPELQIRPMLADDVESVASLARKIWNIHYPSIITQSQIDYMLDQRYSASRLHEELLRPDIVWELAYVGARLVGFSSEHQLSKEGTVELKLDKLYVDPEVQRQGVGGRLIESADRYARVIGASAMILAVNKNNVQAISAYRKHGFQIRESVRVDIGQGFVMDDFIMSRPIGSVASQ